MASKISLVVAIALLPTFASSFEPLFETWINIGVGQGPTAIVVSDLDGDGDADLVGVNSGDQYEEGYSLSVIKNGGNGVFAVYSYETAAFPISVSACDLDGDGDNDLAVANHGNYATPDSIVSVFKNNGNGTFAPKVDYSAGRRPISIFCSDLDGDGDADLSVANLESHKVSILKNNGDGTFEPKVDYSVGAWPCFLTGSDLDLDGDTDLITSSFYCGSDFASVLKNNSDGTFAAKISYWAPATTSVFASDLDGDGLPDLILTNSGQYCFGEDSVLIFKNKGDGTFELKVKYGALDGPSSVVASDFDGDGDNDLAVTNYGTCGPFNCTTGDFISVFLNNGDGTFASKVDFPTGHDPTSLCAADFDRDGDVDLAVVNSSDNEVQIFRNTSGPYYAKGDMDGNGELTLYDVTLLLNCVFYGTGVCKLHFSDVNCNGELTPSDMIIELRALYFGTPFPC